MKIVIASDHAGFNYKTLLVTDIKENTGHGVLPTYPAKPTIADILQNKDVVLNTTFELIKRKL